MVERPGLDPPSEVIYLRDEETGEVWTPTPLPCGPRSRDRPPWPGLHSLHPRQPQAGSGRAGARPARRPGQVGVPHPAKQRRRSRRLSATFYAEWVLGTVRENAPLQVVCEVDPETGAVLARNAWAGGFAGQIAFLAAGPSARVTSDRTEFLGRNGSVSAPAALGRVGLSGRVGPALDPAAAVMTNTELAPGEATELVFVLGQAESLEQVRRLIADLHRRRSSQGGAGRGASSDGITSSNAVQVKTPDPGMDLMLNRWLLYQVLACRVWARSAFYQSGGAYGFRDQLQDVMALSTAPRKRHARRSCGRQPGSSRRAMSSTGGIRRPGSASAPGSATISTSCPWSSTTTSPRPATRSCSTRSCRSSSRRCSAQTRRKTSTGQSSASSPGRCTSIACARWSRAIGSGRTDCPSWAPATGTTA